VNRSTDVYYKEAVAGQTKRAVTTIPAFSTDARSVVAVSVGSTSDITLAQVARRTRPTFLADTPLTFALAVYAFYRAQLYALQHTPSFSV